MEIMINDVISLIGGLNEYQVTGLDGNYLELLCIDFKEREEVTFDITVYNHNTEFWISKDDLHLFELIS